MLRLRPAADRRSSSRPCTQQQGPARRVPSGGTRWIALEHDGQAVRQHQRPQGRHRGVEPRRAAPDPRRRALGDIAQGYIPPGVPGFEESGGLKQASDFDFLRNPRATRRWPSSTCSRPRSRPSVPDRRPGQVHRRREVLTIATNADPGQKTAEVAQGQLEQLGLQADFRMVPQDTLYTRSATCRPKVAICPNVGWFRDFTDPQSLLEPTFNGATSCRRATSTSRSSTSRRSTTR